MNRPPYPPVEEPVEEEVFFPPELFGFYSSFRGKVYRFVWKPEENPHQNGGAFNYQIEAVRKIEEWIETGEEKIILVLGPMMAGKSTILAMLKNNLSPKRMVMAVKHQFDQERVEGGEVVNHPGSWRTEARVYCSVLDLRELGFRGTLLVDEVQFLGSKNPEEVGELTEFLKERREERLPTVVFGLDTDFRRQPWPVVPILLEIADRVVFLAPKCGVDDCQRVGWFTQRMVEENGIWRPASVNDPLVMVGGKEFYRPACEEHHAVLGQDQVQ